MPPMTPEETLILGAKHARAREPGYFETVYLPDRKPADLAILRAHGLLTEKVDSPPLAAAPATVVDTTPHVLHRDYETRSTVDLRKSGIHRYVTDPSTQVLVCGYCIDDGQVWQWVPGEEIPLAFYEAATNPNWTAIAHNAPFELAVEQHVLGPRYSWPQIPLDRNRCTMAAAAAQALPSALKKLSQVLALINVKGDDRVMLQMSKPRRPRKGEDPNGVYWYDDRERFEKLYEYNRADVECERELHERLLPLTDSEHQIWLLNHRINERGFALDLDLAEAARALAEQIAPTIGDELSVLTDGKVTTVHQIERLQTWLRERGVNLDKLDKNMILDALKGELPDDCRRVLELRQGGAQSAANKFVAATARCSTDGRIRSAFKYHAAGTGRFSSSGLQVQNLKRAEPSAELIANIRKRDAALIKATYPDRPVLSLLGDLCRSLIVAAPGKKLIGADFSSIESRVLAQVAGEQGKIEAYRKFDASTVDPDLNPDEPYCVTAARMLGLPPGSITKKNNPDQRNLGKVGDLACGYQGGPRAIEKIAPGKYTDQEKERIKNQWRAQHPKVQSFWREIQKASVDALRHPQRVIECRGMRFKFDGDQLLLKLPSERKLAYPFPRLVRDERFGEWQLAFMDNTQGKWVEEHSYGGLLTENIVQALARDLLTDAMLRLEAAGYPVVMHVHDEIVCEVAESFGTETEFVQLLTKPPAWAPELPVACAAWSGGCFG